MLSYTETPFQEIKDPVIAERGLRLVMKREDQNHPYIRGNKWWKLKYNLTEAKASGKSTLLTYGGAYSNHIVATAAAAKETGFRSIGIIRGEKILPLNPALTMAKEFGMDLHYLPRMAYRNKSKEDAFLSKFHDYFWIPEGGSNDLAVKGVREFASSLGNDFDFVCCAVGTGGTLSGLIEGLPATKRILGFSSLKTGEFLIDEVRRLSDKGRSAMNWQIMLDYHYGGYAKKNAGLSKFIEQFGEEHNIPLEHVYTGKLMAGLFDLVKKGFFPRGSTILAIHSGGFNHQAQVL